MIELSCTVAVLTLWVLWQAGEIRALKNDLTALYAEFYLEHSWLAPPRRAGLAQLAERRFRKPEVEGSMPLPSSNSQRRLSYGRNDPTVD